MIVVTSEAVTHKSCNTVANPDKALSAWEREYSHSKDVLQVYQQDAKAWVICSKNSDDIVINQQVSSSSPLGQRIQLKTWEILQK